MTDTNWGCNGSNDVADEARSGSCDVSYMKTYLVVFKVIIN